MSEEIIDTETASAIRLYRSPEQMLGEAALVGKAVARLVKQNPELVKVIGGRKHPRFELLQIVGNMFRVTARSKETREILDGDVRGWECDAEAYHIPTGQVVATAQAMCCNDEDTWNVRPEYEYQNGHKKQVGEVPVPSFQRRSMAQTRACSKALRLAIGWVLGMAGYEATPAEEMTGPRDQPPQGASAPESKSNGGPQRKSVPGDPISEPQEKRLWALAHNRGLVREAVDAILKRHGFETSAAVTRDKYEAICTEIMNK